jgi:UDP:flavonoid glycosyltransferase YjiC (YdhE family)
MRALFTCQTDLGNFLPLTPVAQALIAAGHDVAFAAPEFLRPTVERAGIRWLRAGIERDDSELTALEAHRRELHGRAFVQFSIEQIFAGILPRRLVPDLLALSETWRPDVFVHDSREFGSMIAAELLGVPHAKVEVHAAGEQPYKMPTLAGALRQLRQTFGLADRPALEWMEQYLVLAPFPAVLMTEGIPLPPTAHFFRALPADAPDQALPTWIDDRGSRPLVYVSLGTLFSNQRGLDIFPKLLEGLHHVDVDVVTTVGTVLDPAVFGLQPEHIHVERFLPLQALLPHCSFVLFHGGSGTLSHAIAHGLPMVIVPLGADQPDNAARCAELGVSRTLDQDQLTPEHIREVTLDMLRTPGYRQAATRLQDEFERLPRVDLAVELLERLARERSPILAAR